MALAIDPEVREVIWDRFQRGSDLPLSVAEMFDLLRPAWMRRALCARRGQALFFIDRGGSTKPAKTLCGACVVREQCLAYALADPTLQGVWGGTTEPERRAMRRGSAVDAFSQKEHSVPEGRRLEAEELQDVE